MPVHSPGAHGISSSHTASPQPRGFPTGSADAAITTAATAPSAQAQQGIASEKSFCSHAHVHGNLIRQSHISAPLQTGATDATTAMAATAPSAETTQAQQGIASEKSGEQEKDGGAERKSGAAGGLLRATSRGKRWRVEERGCFSLCPPEVQQILLPWVRSVATGTSPAHTRLRQGMGFFLAFCFSPFDRVQWQVVDDRGAWVFFSVSARGATDSPFPSYACPCRPRGSFDILH